MCQLFSVLQLRKIVSEVRICTGPMGIQIHIDAQGSLSPYWLWKSYMGAGKSLARPGRKQTTATEDFEIHISYL